MNLIRTWWRVFLKTWKRQPKQYEKLICGRCLGGIHPRKGQQWSRVKWDDHKPRHMNLADCEAVWDAAREKAEAASVGKQL